jgi:hypothetical protein
MDVSSTTLARVVVRLRSKLGRAAMSRSLVCNFIRSPYVPSLSQPPIATRVVSLFCQEKLSRTINDNAPDQKIATGLWPWHGSECDAACLA